MLNYKVYVTSNNKSHYHKLEQKKINNERRILLPFPKS